MREKVSDNPQRISFEVNRSALTTDVIIGKNILENLSNLVVLSTYSQFVIITEKNIGDNYGSQLIKGLGLTSGQKTHTFNLEGGEVNKTKENAGKIMGKILALKDPPVDRKTTLLLALGGGVVGDMTGYIASESLRGLDYFQIPTTLLAMADSSLGGKTGVVYENIKNMIGSFHLPAATIMEIDILESLPRRQIISGFGELIKHAFLDPKIFKFISGETIGSILENDDKLIKLLKLSAEYKMSIVSQDYEEKTGKRKVLNLGHTLGHAFETVTGLGKLTHGEAVAIGLTGIIVMSNRQDLLSDTDTLAMLKIMHEFNLSGLTDTVSDVDRNLLWETIVRGDKKTVNGMPGFVLLKGIGEPEVDCKVDRELFNRVLDRILMKY